MDVSCTLDLQLTIEHTVIAQTLHQDPSTGELLSVDNAPGRLFVPVQSGSSAASRETSPQQPTRPLPPILAPSTATPRLEERMADLSVNGEAEAARRLSSQSASSAVRIDRPSMPSPVFSHPTLLPSQRLPVNLPVSPSFPPQGDDADLHRSFSFKSSSDVPARPSAKALGKRRATSRDDTDVPFEHLTSQTDRMQLDPSEGSYGGSGGGGAGAGAGSRSHLGLGAETGGHSALARLSVPPQPSTTTTTATMGVSPLYHAPPSNTPGRVSPALPPLPTPAAAAPHAPPSLPPVPAAYRVEQQQQQQQRERRAPPLPTTPGNQAQAGPGTGTGTMAMGMQSNNPYAAAAAAGFTPVSRVGSNGGGEAQHKTTGYTSPPLPPHPSRAAGAAGAGAGQRSGHWR